nr:MAG TPA: hypothetical protein [Caudoviricetes sp.]
MKKVYTAVKKTVHHRKAIEKAKKLGLHISSFNNVNICTIEMMYENCNDFQLYINDGIIIKVNTVLRG